MSTFLKNSKRINKTIIVARLHICMSLQTKTFFVFCPLKKEKSFSFKGYNKTIIVARLHYISIEIKIFYNAAAIDKTAF